MARFKKAQKDTKVRVKGKRSGRPTKEVESKRMTAEQATEYLAQHLWRVLEAYMSKSSNLSSLLSPEAREYFEQHPGPVLEAYKRLQNRRSKPTQKQRKG